MSNFRTFRLVPACSHQLNPADSNIPLHTGDKGSTDLIVEGHYTAVIASDPPSRNPFRDFNPRYENGGDFFLWGAAN